MNSPEGVQTKGKKWMGDEELIFRRWPEGRGGRKKESLEEPDKGIKTTKGDTV